MQPEFTGPPAFKNHALITMRHKRPNGWLPTVAIAVAVSSMDPPVWKSIVTKHKMEKPSGPENHLSVKHGGNAPIAENSCGWGECPSCCKQVDLHMHRCHIQRPRTLMESGKRNERCNWPSEKNGGVNMEEMPQGDYEPFGPIQRRKTRNNQTNIRNLF